MPAASHNAATTCSKGQPESCSRRWPAMTSSPRSPSTMLRRVAAATTPSRPPAIIGAVCAFMAANVGCAEFTVNIDWIINMKKPASPWLNAAEATALLGVNRATLYAYVSRGRIRSEPGTGNTRHRRYSRDDVERLRARTDERRDPQKAAGRALQWGLPVLESAITLIADGRIFYRGRDATQLATSSTIAEVAALLWTGTADPAPFDDLRPIDVKRIRGEASFIARAQIALAAAAPRD